MKTEVRFLLAIVLMLVVMVGTNMLFPPIPPEPQLPPDGSGVDSAGEVVADPGGLPATGVPTIPGVAPGVPGVATPAGPPTETPVEAIPERRVTVESDLYRFEFSSLGARLLSAEMSQFEDLSQGGRVDLIPEGADGYLSQRLVVGSDTLDLSRLPYRVDPERGLQLASGGGEGTLRFVYEDPASDFRFEIAYTFDPDRYQVGVEGLVVGLERPVLLTDLGEGLAFVEADPKGETRMMAYVYNDPSGDVESTLLTKAEPTYVPGPLVWVAFKSKFFVMALLAGESAEQVSNTEYLSGLLVREGRLPEGVRAAAARAVGNDGRFAYRLFLGPLEYTRLQALGQGMEGVNPYGFKLIRPVLGPIVWGIMWVLRFLHERLSLGYGWVLVVFGVGMRVVLFPLNHKAMKAQLRTQAVQPLMQEIQKKYKDNPEKLQKEMMKLYKEHGFNPLAGCWPMLLPMPILFALFFVFQNTIELRGVPFLWLADLSAKDPIYVLPILLAVSMFLMQWVTMRSLDAPNPQMKMMMWMMPPMMLFIFANLASGLNLYYMTSNIATIPQQVWIAKERKKAKGLPPLKPKRE